MSRRTPQRFGGWGSHLLPGGTGVRELLEPALPRPRRPPNPENENLYQSALIRGLDPGIRAQVWRLRSAGQTLEATLDHASTFLEETTCVTGDWPSQRDKLDEEDGPRSARAARGADNELFLSAWSGWSGQNSSRATRIVVDEDLGCWDHEKPRSTAGLAAGGSPRGHVSSRYRTHGTESFAAARRAVACNFEIPVPAWPTTKGHRAAPIHTRARGHREAPASPRGDGATPRARADDGSPAHGTCTGSCLTSELFGAGGGGTRASHGASGMALSSVHASFRRPRPWSAQAITVDTRTRTNSRRPAHAARVRPRGRASAE